MIQEKLLLTFLMSAAMVEMSETIVPMSTGMSSTDEYPVMTKSHFISTPDQRSIFNALTALKSVLY